MLGAAILAAASIIVKIIGAFYKIPLGMILGPVTMLFIISLYKAHIFDSSIKLFKKLYEYTENHFKVIKTNIRLI